MRFRNTPVEPARNIAELLALFQETSHMDDDELAKQLGLGKGNVVAMMKRGSVRLPMDKVEPLAEVTGIDFDDVLELALQEREPALLHLFQRIRARNTLSASEQRLVEYCRTLAGDREVSPFVIDGRSVVALMIR